MIQCQGSFGVCAQPMRDGIIMYYIMAGHAFVVAKEVFVMETVVFRRRDLLV